MINKILKSILPLFVLTFHFALALPKYEFVDLGLFETDESEAIAVNDSGQVAGFAKIGEYSYLFLWDIDTGLKLIDPPTITATFLNHQLKLNNSGQIFGFYNNNTKHVPFIWDKNFGFLEIDLPGFTYHHEVHFNDKSQIVCPLRGTNGYVDYLLCWDNGHIKNLSNEFKQQIHGDWTPSTVMALNNHGRIIIGAYQHDKNSLNRTRWKSFSYYEGKFEELMPQLGPNVDLTVSSMDDNGNLIAYFYGKWYFVESISGFRAYIFENQWNLVLKNNLPLSINCLPGELKKDRNGQYYFSAGLYIRKLLPEGSPYFQVDHESTRINDQNSKGYVVGRINTMFPASHAFLAVPVEEENDPLELPVYNY